MRQMYETAPSLSTKRTIVTGKFRFNLQASPFASTRQKASNHSAQETKNVFFFFNNLITTYLQLNNYNLNKFRKKKPRIQKKNKMRKREITGHFLNYNTIHYLHKLATCSALFTQEDNKKRLE